MSKPDLNREFVRLWSLHGQRVYAYILTLLPNQADAEELFQETGVTLWEKFGEFRPGTDFRAWARQVAFNKVRSFRQLRRHSTVLLSDDVLGLVDRAARESASALDAQSSALADCLARLSSKDRLLIRRRYQEGLTVKAISAKVGRSGDAVYKALQRIHDALFDCVTSSAVQGGES